jgi:FMN phosphatase YigB (HAD superfamily)
MKPKHGVHLRAALVDIAPAQRLGLTAILIHPDDAAPASTVVDAFAPSLDVAAGILRRCCAPAESDATAATK